MADLSTEPQMDQPSVISPPADSYDKDETRGPSASFALAGIASENLQVYIAGCFASGFILMSQSASILSQGLCFLGTSLCFTASQVEDSDYHGKVAYAVAVGTVGLVVALGAFLIERQGIESPLKQVLAIFQAVWWISALWLTFANPYKGDIVITSWFVLWLGAVCSLFYALLASPALNGMAERAKGSMSMIQGHRKMSFGCALFSLVCMIAASVKCSDDDYCKKENGYAVALGVIGFVVSIAAFILASRIQPFMKFIAGFLFIWWAIGALVITGIWDSDDAVFPNLSNGYISTWLAFFTSTGMLVHALSNSGGMSEQSADAEATV